MNRRSNARGVQNRPQQQQQQQAQVQQQYEQHFVPSNGANPPAPVKQQQPPQQQQQAQPTPQKPQPQAQKPQPQPQAQSQPQVMNFEPTVDPNDDQTPMESGDEADGGIGAKMRKIFAHRKTLTPADRKRLEKERKARQLRRLRKLLTPKNAVVALHELQGPGMSEFVINTNGQETTAEIVVNNVRYEATAPNKHLAKARASEKALRDLVIAQMAKARQNAEKQSTNGDDADGDKPMAEDEDAEMADVSDNDEVPMLHLASYALYKLFNEWQSEGFEIPAIKPTKAPPTHPLAPKVPKTKADVPADAPSRHPTALLAFMRPQVPYEDLGSNNTTDPAKREFSVGVTVDGCRFIGKARSKKMARKEAAAAACRQLFDVQFVETSAATA